MATLHLSPNTQTRYLPRLIKKVNCISSPIQPSANVFATILWPLAPPTFRLDSQQRRPHSHRSCLASALLRNVALYCKRLLISLTQSSSVPGPAPSASGPRAKAGSAILERFMHGMGYGEARTVTVSPGLSMRASCPSIDTFAGALERSPIYHSFPIAKNINLKKICGGSKSYF